MEDLKFYLYKAEWGYHGSCSEPGDGGYYGFLTTVDEVTMKERMRAAANALGDDYKHCEFLKTQTDGFGFDAEYESDFTPEWGWKPTVIDLDEIKREDLWSEEKMSEILAERERIAAEKRRQEQEQKKKWAREKDQRELHRIMKEHPDLWNEARKWAVIEEK